MGRNWEQGEKTKNPSHPCPLPPKLPPIKKITGPLITVEKF